MPGDLKPQFAVFIPFVGRPDEVAVRALASTTGLAAADARVLLSSRIPRRVLSVVTEAEAADRALTLRGAGFDAFWASFESLRVRPVRAQSAQLRPEGIEFQPGGAMGVRLAVHGRIDSSRQTKTTVSGRSKYGALVPVSSGAGASGDSEPFVVFYGASPAQAVEIRPRGFNFRFLGPAAGSTKAQSLRVLFDELKARCPAMHYDDTLLHVTPPSEEVGYSESFDEGALGSIESTRKAQSNEPGALRAALLIALAAFHP